MFGFLQGFAYGLFLSCIPWFLIGMANPRLAVPGPRPGRWEVVLRYWFIIPFLAFLLWLTSLWGGFGPSLAGWLAGLAAIAVAVPVERGARRWLGRWRAWRQRRVQEAEARRDRVRREREQREAGVARLDPRHPPDGADAVVLDLCAAKQRLLDLSQGVLADQTDRLYSRYLRVLEVIDGRFSAGEVTHQRARGLVQEVCRSAVDNFTAMASQAAGIVGLDVLYARRRLAEASASLPAEEREALEARLSLVEETEGRLRELAARNEAVMTALDSAAVAVSRIETGKPRASVAAEQALADLRRFTERAESYGRAV